MDDLDEDDSLTFRLVDDAGGGFAVEDNCIVVAGRSKLNQTGNYEHTIVVAADHEQGGTTQETFVISVADNDAPSQIRLASNSVSENAVGVVVGELIVSSADNTHTTVLTL
jgi:hypothetical protein